MATPPRTVVLHRRPDCPSFGIYVGHDVPSGIYIVTIEPNSPASDAHIQPGDRILAINGQLVTSMHGDPKQNLIQIAAIARKLTLTIQSTNILESVNYFPSNNNYYHHQYPSMQNGNVDHDLEQYMRSIFGDDSLRIIPSTTANRNEFILTSVFQPARSVQHRQKQRFHTTKERPKTMYNNNNNHNNKHKENDQALSRYRSIPNMGTSHMILRNSQANSRTHTSDEQQEIKPIPPIINNRDFNTEPTVNFNPELFIPPTQPFHEEPIVSPVDTFQPAPNPVNNRTNPDRNYPSSSINGEGLREVHLRRSPNFEGFGFHLHYNKFYYLINQIEPNSPAEQSGLHVNDIIRKVNDESTEHMSHQYFVELLNSSTGIVFLVQPFTEYYRANPHVPMLPNNTNSQPSTNNQNDGDKRQSMIAKAWTKLKFR